MSVPRALARLALAAATILAGGCTRSAAPPPTPVRPDATSICFSEPRLEAPDTATRRRVSALTAHLAEPERSWVSALATHESGGVAGAISPTGCAGPLAILSCFACAPCCVSDELDRSRRFYDSCSWEEEHGYLCDRRDRRFRGSWATKVALRTLRSLRSALDADPEADVSFAVALAVRWNAGAGSVEAFPDGLASAGAAVERLRLFEVEPYRSWAPEDRWNKVVEVYDYARWLPYLQRIWAATESEPIAARGEASDRCFDVVGERLLAATRRPGSYRRIDTVRLRMGRYLHGEVELQ